MEWRVMEREIEFRRNLRNDNGFNNWKAIELKGLVVNVRSEGLLRDEFRIRTSEKVVWKGELIGRGLVWEEGGAGGMGR